LACSEAPRIRRAPRRLRVLACSGIDRFSFSSSAGLVMSPRHAGLVPGIHAFSFLQPKRGWPGIGERKRPRHFFM
jgi:hypothetical protein